MKSSRLLKRLDTDIAAAPTPLDADCLRAERACHAARLGEVDEAKSTVVTLRQRYRTEPQARMSVWLSLAEGLEGYFRDLAPWARDKVSRAHALSSASRLVPLQALCAAWLAQMDFTRLDVESVAHHAREALRLAEPADHAARGRVALVLAQALHTARRVELALPWYQRARMHAASEGDNAAKSALMHNIACMRSDNLRQARLSGATDRMDSDWVQIAADTTGRFDRMFDAASLTPVSALLQARILSLKGRYEDALALYEQQVTGEADHALARMKSDLMSDVAWCRVQLGRHEEALRAAAEAEAALAAETQIDDRAATHTRLGWMFRTLGDDATAKRHEDQAQEAWTRFSQLQTRIAALLGEIGEKG